MLLTLFHREQVHPAANNLQDSCLAWGLFEHCGNAGCVTSTPRVMLGCLHGRLTSLVSTATMGVKGSASVHCRCSCTSGTAALQELKRSN